MLDDPQSLTILTELYDKHWVGSWTKRLKNSPDVHLKDPCITMLGGSTPAHLETMLKDSDVEGGFVARLMIVYSDTMSRPNSLMRKPAHVLDIKKQAEYLKTFLKIPKGSFFTATDKARDLHDRWYINMRQKKQNDGGTGFANRLGDHVLKLAMCLSLAESTNLEINANHMFKAIQKCIRLQYGFAEVFTVKADKYNPLSRQTVLVAKYIRTNKCITRYELLKALSGLVNAAVLDRVVKDLVASGHIRVEVKRPLKNTEYSWRQDA